MPEHRRRRATPSGGGKPLAPFGLRAAQTRLLCCGSSMVLGHHLCRRASHPDPRRLQHGLSDFCHGLLDSDHLDILIMLSSLNGFPIKMAIEKGAASS